MSLTRRPLLAGAAVLPLAARAQSLSLRFPGGRDETDRRYEALEELLLLVLHAAGQAVRIERVPGLTQTRRVVELQAGRLDVGFNATTSAELGSLPLVRQPLRRGLLGVRLLLAPRELAPRLAQLRSVDALRAWRLGYGSDWADLGQMQTLGFRTITASSYSGLFRMLAQRRFDWMHRGVNEIWAELDHPSLMPNDVAVVPGLALYYPLDDYFCVSPARAELLPLLTLGFERILLDGRYAQWFRRRFGAALARAGFGQRRVLPLVGYGVPPGTPLEAFDALRLDPTRGTPRLP